MSASTIIGTASGMHVWAALDGTTYIAIGSEQRLALLFGGLLYDITPLVATHNVAVSFSTTNGSAVVTITDAAHGTSVDSWVNIFTAVSVGGKIIQSFYKVVTVVDVNNYTINIGANATSTVANGGAVAKFVTTNGSAVVEVDLNNHGLIVGDVYTVHVSTVVGGVTMLGAYSVQTVIGANSFTVNATVATSSTNGFENGGNVRLEYLLAPGLAAATAAEGYGGGNYGAGDYGSGTTGSKITALRQWSMDNWGEFLVANPTNGKIYYWAPPITSSNTATVVTGAPVQNTCLFVQMPAQILVAAGTETGGTFDPNLVRWCDVSDFNTWTASATNQAGSFRVPTGSRIVGALGTTQQALIWTDTALYTMTYQGLPFVFGFNRVGSNCGLIAMRAAAIIGTQIVWMSSENFFSYGPGGVQSISCTVWDEVFQNLDTSQPDKIFAWTNSLFNEIWWFYPTLSSGDGTVDAYVKVNLSSGLWDYGTLTRTAGHEGGPILSPISVDENAVIQKHEQGYDANGQILHWYFQTGYIDLSDGEDFIFIDTMFPDFKTLTSASTPIFNITLYTRDYPEGPTTTSPTYPYIWGDPYVSLRVRGRQVSIKIAGDDIGTFARLGAIRYRFSQDGKR